jgi:hypothetical protein
VEALSELQRQVEKLRGYYELAKVSWNKPRSRGAFMLLARQAAQSVYCQTLLACLGL